MVLNPDLKQRKTPTAKQSLLAELFRPIDPNWKHYIRYVDLAARKGDTAMARFMDAYNALPMMHKLGWWPEQVCQAAKVNPWELVGAVCRHMWETNASMSAMIASMAHPKLIESTLRFAKKEANFKDREMFFRMTGSLPDRKGASINIFTQAAGELQQGEQSLRGGKLKTFDSEVIDMSRDLEDDGGKTLYKVFENVSREDSREDD